MRHRLLSPHDRFMRNQWSEVGHVGCNWRCSARSFTVSGLGPGADKGQLGRSGYCSNRLLVRDGARSKQRHLKGHGGEMVAWKVAQQEDVTEALCATRSMNVTRKTDCPHQ